MFRRIIPAGVLIALAISAVSGQGVEFNRSRMSEKGLAAYDRLREAWMFRLGPVGFTGETSTEERALQDLLREPEAIEALRSLCRSATAAGSLYGLVGLRTRSTDLFREEMQLYRERSGSIEKSEPDSQLKSPTPEAGQGTVFTQSGCVITPMSVDSVLRGIEAGFYRASSEL